MVIQEIVTKNVRKYWGLPVVLLISIIAILPFFHAGFFPSHDDTQIGRIQQMAQSLSDGLFPVRWVKDLGYGYGYPIFNFYAPLPYYVGGFLTLLGLSPLISTKIIFILALLLSAISMYFLCRALFGQISGIVGGVIYMYFPYHAVNTFVRGNLSELFGYALLPLIFLCLYGLFKSSNYKKNRRVWLSVVLLGVSTAALMISHNLSMYMVLLMLAPVSSIFIWWVQQKKRFLLLMWLGIGLGFALSAFYWIPAIFEMSYTDVLSQIGGGSYYADHFVCLSQFWSSPWGFTGSVPGCVDGMSFRLGKSNILFGLLSIVIVLWSYRHVKDNVQKAFLLSMLVILFFSLFMMLSYAEFVWQIIPRSDFLQFPWRFLNMVGFSISVIIAGALYCVQNFSKNIKLIGTLSIAIILVTLGLNAKLFIPQQYYLFDNEYYASKEYLSWYVSKQSDEYLPKGFTQTKSENDINRSPLHITNGTIQQFTYTTGELKADVNLLQDELTTIHIAYFPNWKYFIDGRSIAVKPVATGAQIQLPKGAHTITASYQETSLERAANAITLLSIAAVAMVTIALQYKNFYAKKTS